MIIDDVDTNRCNLLPLLKISLSLPSSENCTNAGAGPVSGRRHDLRDALFSVVNVGVTAPKKEVLIPASTEHYVGKAS